MLSLMKGDIPMEFLRHFLSFDVRRRGQELCVEDYEVICPLPTRGGKRKGGKETSHRRAERGPRPGN